MSRSNIAISASRNEKEQPHGLYVHGSVMVFTQETEVKIERAEPQGINPSVLLLRLTITERPGPMKGVPRHFVYEERGAQVDAYKSIQVSSTLGDSCTVDVEVLG